MTGRVGPGPGLKRGAARTDNDRDAEQALGGIHWGRGMNVSTRPDRHGHARERTVSDAALKAAAWWVAQLARTLKTCRLYDRANPTVVKFRDELAVAAYKLTGEHGTLTFRFESADVTLDGESLHPARSRDDNLAYPFHRDGVRGLTLNPGVEAAEIDALVDAVLLVTGQNPDDGDDLVTLLWESNLRHIDIDYIPAEGDVGDGDGSAAAADDGKGPLLPWPTVASGESPATPEEAQAAKAEGRAEDWQLGELTVEVEASFVELDALAPGEIERFRAEYAREREVPPVTAALAIAAACRRAPATENDRTEIGRFVPRVLRGALGVGAWADARGALRELRDEPLAAWSEETLLQELMQPVSIQRTVEKLDAQDETGHAEFVALAQELGDAGIDWVTLVLSESQQRTTRLALAQSLAARCGDNPERLAPWLSDARWYVVRNIVHILGWIGGPDVVNLLATPLKHPDVRVREQVVGALTNIDLKLTRPLLVRAIEGAETKMFCQVLHQLSRARDAATARFVFAFLEQEKFATRPAEERRAIYAALASVGGDEIVPDLEAELLRTNWFDKQIEIHRHNVARCLARVGTPRARAVLESGAQSKRAPVRLAAQAALAWLGGAA